MTTSIWIHYARPRTNWYSLNDAARDEIERQWTEATTLSKQEGGAYLGRYHIRGQQDFETVEIWKFADVDATARHWERLTAARYNEYFAFANNLGLAMEVLP